MLCNKKGCVVCLIHKCKHKVDCFVVFILMKFMIIFCRYIESHKSKCLCGLTHSFTLTETGMNYC
jgi:hypothetical protein